MNTLEQGNKKLTLTQNVPYYPCTNKPAWFVHFTGNYYDLKLSLSKRVLLYNVRFWKMVIVT